MSTLSQAAVNPIQVGMAVKTGGLLCGAIAVPLCTALARVEFQRCAQQVDGWVDARLAMGGKASAV
eukprot:CAMPEP_0197627898 /NCGR_PEP_ID=MMETSP1338-20131121/6380_1 /TAXON_ID=43686 ORGANISM="Pelagodinium beii, Strain RCC1491" /NCGR_SAMPLE_ID=MMETSP1338 /ASSEMBLY_ACC=CAM_ASM_000754 /LENGTH=65 /DNA_ID=CAMNT_0043198741 /DNA_START=876 /DNA_END=1073 /DNA_ORIENTATION=-